MKASGASGSTPKPRRKATTVRKAASKAAPVQAVASGRTPARKPGSKPRKKVPSKATAEEGLEGEVSGLRPMKLGWKMERVLWIGQKGNGPLSKVGDDILHAIIAELCFDCQGVGLGLAQAEREERGREILREMIREEQLRVERREQERKRQQQRRLALKRKLLEAAYDGDLDAMSEALGLHPEACDSPHPTSAFDTPIALCRCKRGEWGEISVDDPDENDATPLSEAAVGGAIPDSVIHPSIHAGLCCTV
mmetsp:Transcript_64419/g.140264  ORF Transcript_64419/g.140264 Transcript_64419/m.140264 type:complete len:251 (-) Transcript_64419:247-999(-)